MMRNHTFGNYVDKKKRETVRQLKLIKNALEHSKFQVEDFLNGDDNPYIYCRNNLNEGSFDGIRIYKIGNEIAFRVQKESKTHPYGSAYSIPVEDMFHDFMSDDGMDEEKAGRKIIESISKEIKKFFEMSIDADNQYNRFEIEQGMGNSMSNGTYDYSATVINK